MCSSLLDSNSDLGKRIAALLTDRENDLRTLWQQNLEQNAPYASEGVFEQIRGELVEGQDLLGTLINILSEDTSVDSSDLSYLINKVRTKTYSISDFFYELNSFDDAFAEILRASADFSSDEKLDYMRVVKTKLVNIFELILKETSEVYEYLTEHGKIGFCQLDPNGVISYANNEMQSILGIGEKLAGLRFSDYFTGADREHVLNSLVAEDDQPSGNRELCVRRMDTRCLTVWAEVRPLYIGGKRIGAYALVMDISPIEKRTNQIYERSKMGVIKVTKDGKITYANATMLDILGVHEVKEQNAEDFIFDEADRIKFRKQLEKRVFNESDTYNIRLKRQSDNKVIPVRVTGTPITDTQGNQIGSIGMVQDLQLDMTIRHIHEHIASTDDYEEMLGNVARTLQELIPFDIFVVSQFSTDGHFTRPIYTYPPQENKWRKHYYYLSDPMLKWINSSSKIYIEEDIEEFVSQKNWVELKDEKELHQLIANKMLSFIRVAVLSENKIIASISLFKQGRSAYSQDLKETITQLPLDKAVLMALHYTEKKELQFRLNLVKEIVNCSEFDEIANKLVKSLSEHYKWSHVSLFKVDDINKVITLEAQQAILEESIRLPDDYSQPIDAGLMSHVYRTKQAINLGDVHSPKYKDIYIEGSPETKSELCYPILFQGEVQWILNLEDKHVNAYSDDELTALKAVLDEVSSVLERLAQHHFYSACFVSTSDAVIMANNSMQIINANPSAASMLGYSNPRELKGLRMTSFTSDENMLQELFSRTSVSNIQLKMKRKNGNDIRVLVSSSQLQDGHKNRILMAKDITDVKRMEELAFMGQMSYEVASQTQVPLSLTSSWLRRLLDGRVPQEQYTDVIEKTLSQLKKVQLGYDRLMMYDIDHSMLPKKTIQLNPAVELKRVLDEFPLAERNKIRFEHGEHTAYISGDPFQIRFIMESILSYLLRFVPEENMIDVDMQIHDGNVKMKFSGFKTPTKHFRRDSDNFVARVQADLALGTPIIKSFSHSHGGDFNFEEHSDNKVSFNLSLPVCHRTAIMEDSL